MPNPSNASVFPRLSLASFSLLLACVVFALVPAARAQESAPAAAPPPKFSMESLRPALTNAQNAITAANLARWKIPNDVRANTQQDVNSMQRDMSATLPNLMSAADAAPSSNGSPALAPAFAVFRNLDALYDVLLRVSEVANVGATAGDAGSLETARAGLEDARGKLGAWLLQAIGAQDAQLAQAVAAAARPPAPPPPPNKVIVDDGPENPKPRKKKAAPPSTPQ